MRVSIAPASIRSFAQGARPALSFAALLLVCALLLAGCAPAASDEGSSQGSSAPAGGDAQGAVVTDTAQAAATGTATGTSTRALQGAIAPVATDTAMDASITCIDLTSGATASIAGINQQPASSLIKLAVAAAYFDNEAAGVISRDEEHTIMDYEVVGGSGNFQNMVGTTVTMGDAVYQMISNSDNVACNIIIDRLGMYTINQSIQKLGFTGTQLTTRILDPESSRWNADNVMTSDDAASLLKQVYEGSLVNPDASSFILESLRAQTDADGALAGLPEGTSFAHQAAWSWNCRHDAGIVEGEHPYVLVVMCSEQDVEIDNGAALDLIARAAAAAQSAIAG